MTYIFDQQENLLPTYPRHSFFSTFLPTMRPCVCDASVDSCKKMMFPVVDISPFSLSTVNIDIRKVIEKFPNWRVHIKRSEKPLPLYRLCFMWLAYTIYYHLNTAQTSILTIPNKRKRKSMGGR